VGRVDAEEKLLFWVEAVCVYGSDGGVLVLMRFFGVNGTCGCGMYSDMKVYAI